MNTRVKINALRAPLYSCARDVLQWHKSTLTIKQPPKGGEAGGEETKVFHQRSPSPNGNQSAKDGAKPNLPDERRNPLSKLDESGDGNAPVPTGNLQL